MKTTNVLNLFGFELDEQNENLYHRKGEDNNNDVIRYMPTENLYNLSLEDDSYDFIDEKQLLNILTKLYL